MEPDPIAPAALGNGMRLAVPIAPAAVIDGIIIDNTLIGNFCDYLYLGAHAPIHHLQKGGTLFQGILLK